MCLVASSSVGIVSGSDFATGNGIVRDCGLPVADMIISAGEKTELT